MLTFTNAAFNPATAGVTGTRTLTIGGSYTGASSVNNRISGVGTVSLEGDFVIDTTAANAPPAGSSWTLESVASLSGAYGANFTGETIDLDHDNDGVPNGVEYFLFGSANSTGFTTLPGVVGNTVTWTKAASGYSGNDTTNFVVETSTTLSGVWGTAALGAGAGQVVLSGNNVIYTFPAGLRNFARLKVTGP